MSGRTELVIMCHSLTVREGRILKDRNTMSVRNKQEHKLSSEPPEEKSRVVTTEKRTEQPPNDGLVIADWILRTDYQSADWPCVEPYQQEKGK